jgi:hypothetical protein
MRAAVPRTWVQVIKAVLLIAGAAVMSVWILALSGFNFSALLGDGAAAGAPLGPGKQYGVTALTKLDFVSLSIALVLGTAGLPHILMRFYTIPTAKEARKSVVWAIWLIGLFYLFTLPLGYGAAALVGPERILAAPGKANSAAPLLAYRVAVELLMDTQLPPGQKLHRDLHLPRERPASPERLTPARVRSGFRHLRAKTPLPARALKPAHPGPGRPPGTRNTRPAPHHPAGNIRNPTPQPVPL